MQQPGDPAPYIAGDGHSIQYLNILLMSAQYLVQSSVKQRTPINLWTEVSRNLSCIYCIPCNSCAYEGSMVDHYFTMSGHPHIYWILVGLKVQ